MGIIAQDGFSGEGSNVNLSSHVPDTTGTSWVEEEITGIRFYQVYSASNNIGSNSGEASQRVIDTVRPNPTSPEYDVYFTCATLPNDSTSPYWLIGRFTNITNMYGAGTYRSNAANDKQLYKKVAGVSTQLAQTDTGLSTGDIFKFQIKDATKKLFKGVTEQLSSTDNTLTSVGRAGIALGNVFGSGGKNAAGRFDNFKVDQTGAQIISIGSAFEVDAAQILGGTALNFVKTMEIIDWGAAIRNEAPAITLSKNQTKANCIIFPTESNQDNSIDVDTYNADFFFDPAQTRDVKVLRGPAADGFFYPNAAVVEVDPNKVTVRQGTFTISGGSSFVDADIGATVVTGKTFLIFSHRYTGGTNRGLYYQVAGKLLDVSGNATQIRFQRGGTDGEVAGHWFLAESLGNEFSVQHIEVIIPGASASADSSAFTQVQRNKTLLIASSYTDETRANYDSSYAVCPYLIAGATPNYITVERSGSPSGVTVTTWIEVISFLGEESVLDGVVSTIDQDTFVDMTGVPQGRSMPWSVVGRSPSMQNVIGQQGYIHVSYAKLYFDGNNLHIQRKGTVQTPAKVSWQIVEFSLVGPIVVGQVGERDEAQAIAVPKTIDLNQTTESDFAQSVSRPHLVILGQPTETDTVQIIAWAPKQRMVDQAIESDLAQIMERSKTGAVVQIAETDLAQTIARIKAGTLGQAVETDLAQTIARIKAGTLGQAVETDLAQAIARLKTRAIGQVTEIDVAQALTHQKLSLIAQVVESDSAQALGHLKTLAILQAVDTDLAQAIGRIKIAALGQITETDLAQAITEAGGGVVLMDQAVETDLAQAIARLKTRAIGQVTEIDVAQTLTHRKLSLIAQVVESDSAQALGHLKTLAILQALETDMAQAITAPGGLQPAVILLANFTLAIPKLGNVSVSIPELGGISAGIPKLKSVTLVH